MNSREQAPDANAGVDKRVVLFVATMASFLTPFMGSAVNVAIPSIGREFAMNAITLTWIPMAYLLAAAMFLVPLGKLADISGRRKIFVFGMVGYTIMSLLCSLATSETMLIAFRALQGFSDAMMFGTSMAIVVSVIPPSERGRALGITVAGVYSGSSLGPFIGGFITHYFGWRSIFYLTAVLGATVVVATLWKLRGEWYGARGQKLDLVGSGIYAFTLLAVMYGLSLLPASTGYLLIALGLICLVAFVLWESHVANPVLDVRLFRHNRTFAFSNLAALINYSSTFAISFLLSLYLQYVKGLDPNTAGIIMLSQPVVMAVFSPLAGRLADRIEPRIVSSTGMAFTALGLTQFAFLDAGSGLPRVVVALLTTGLGFALFSSPNTSAIMGSVDRAYYGVASATTGAMRLIGQMLSIGIAALIIDEFVGKVQITPPVYPAFLAGSHFGFLLFAGLCLVGVFASLSRGKLHAEAPAGPPRIVSGSDANRR